MTTDQPTPNAYAKLARRFGLCPACNRPAVSHSGEGCPQRPADVLPQEPPVGEFVACGPDSDLLPFFRRCDEGWFGINGDEGATWSEVVDFARERAGRDPVRLVPAMGEQLAAALTAQQQAVIDAAKKLARHIAGEIDPDDRCPEEQALLAAVTGLKPPAPALPPIPEPGLYLDRNECIWRIHADGAMDLVDAGQGCHWDQGHTYGPFTRLMPATDVVDVALVRDLADGIRRQADLCHIHYKYIPDGAGGRLLADTSLAECESEEYACGEARDLLARAEGATGGGR